MIVWDSARREEIYFLKGLMGEVVCTAFSPDGRFLAAADTEGKVLVWDMETGLLATTVKHCPVCTTLVWGNIAEVDESRLNRHAQYIPITAHPDLVYKHSMAFDLRTMQYELTTAPFALPSMGLRRTYTRAVVTPTDEYVMLTTEQGDFSVFNIPNMIYRSSVPVSSNGAMCLCLSRDSLYAGSGDGKLKKSQGSDLEWEEIAETSLAGKVMSVSLTPDESELIVGTSAGKMYRVRTVDLSTFEIADSHTGPVTSVAFGTRSDIFSTASGDHTCRVWDLSDYSSRCRSNVPGATPGCLEIVNDDTLVTGWSDGGLRGFDAENGDMIWHLTTAHRGKVTSTCTTPTLMASSGEDGAVRLWSTANRELLTQFTEHTKEVTGLCVDETQPNLLHSCSLDNSTVTMDMKKERRGGYHMMKGAAFHCMSQRKDSETELVTGNADGTIMFWDADESTPVIVWQHPSKERIQCVEVSPSGRYLASAGDDQNVTIWDIVAGTLIASGVCHSSRVNSVKWSPDEKQLVSAGDDCSICVWSTSLIPTCASAPLSPFVCCSCCIVLHNCCIGTCVLAVDMSLTPSWLLLIALRLLFSRVNAAGGGRCDRICKRNKNAEILVNNQTDSDSCSAASEYI